MQSIADELMVGNYLKKLDDSVFEVTAEDILKIKITNIKLQPIPLTLDWVIELGYIKNHDEEFENNGLIVATFEEINVDRIFLLYKRAIDQPWNKNFVCTIKYVHELQNLNFLIKREKIVLKPCHDK